MSENEAAYSVYCRCSDDWIMSGGMEPHRMAISGPAIETAIRIAGVKGRRKKQAIFDMVKMAGRAVAKAINDEMAEKAEERKAG